ncbi:hypothetical protein NEIELOOT_00809 [Neisseria elongata subsp. glycolytica ATCC 29315]|uniref:Uncharacterized protein n=1 Tax=Neisseria elongata subsp. glycolytica ATCC 29315 TaxID=546263 RepID=D4DP25_NEIEG|nr:hypothetical protein NEIELOOT_00809 [Neisseria elongata subsp. glycolytica ATCC 29315]
MAMAAAGRAAAAKRRKTGRRFSCSYRLFLCGSGVNGEGKCFQTASWRGEAV